MENTKKRQDKKLSVKILGVLLSFCLIVAMLPPVSAAAEENVRKLQNALRKDRTLRALICRPPL